MPVSEWTRSGGLRIRLEADACHVCRGAELTGRVQLHSVSRKPLVLSELHVWFWAGRYVSEEGYADPHCQVARNLTLSPNERQTLPFMVSVPDDAPITRTYLGFGPRQVGVTYDSPHLKVQVWPEPRFVDLALRLAGVSGHDLTSWSSTRDRDGFVARLTPNPAMRSLFKGLALELYPEGSSIYGRLIVDPGVRSLGDALRAAAFSGLRRYRVRFTASQLPYAEEKFARLLRPFMDDGRHLPIPAESEERDELPRAADPPRPDPRELPVPDTTRSIKSGGEQKLYR